MSSYHKFCLVLIRRGWYKGFKSDCPDGNLKREKILEVVQLILPPDEGEAFVDQIFRIFDKDGNGSIDFKEFMMATDMTSAGTPEEKLKWTFKVKMWCSTLCPSPFGFRFVLSSTQGGRSLSGPLSSSLSLFVLVPFVIRIVLSLSPLLPYE